MQLSEDSLSIAFALVAVLAAAQAVTWVVFGWSFRKRVEPAPGALEQQRTLEMIAQLHSLATTMAGQVEHHMARVDSVNHALGDMRPGATLDGDFTQIIENTVGANASLRQELAEAEAKLQEQAGQIERYMAAAHTDVLTGLANRRAFDDELQRRIADHQRRGTPVGVLLLDVDHFKRFNDRFGHQAGDRVLRGVARVLLNTVREVDLVARYGGEEFAVLIGGVSIEDAAVIAERARLAVAQQPFRHGDQDLSVTISVGLAALAAHETGAACIKRADAALYASKQAGRNCSHLHFGDAIVAVGASHPAGRRRAADQQPRLELEARLTSPAACRDLAALCDDLRQRIADVVTAEV